MSAALLVRVQTGPQVGAGHLMRCVALSQSWLSEVGPVHFAVSEASPQSVSQLQRAGLDVHPVQSLAGGEADAATVRALADRVNAVFIVVDGPAFEADYHRQVRAGGVPLLLVDDLGRDDVVADLVLNPNSFANADLYPNLPPHTRLLLGAPFVQLRPEFSRQRDHVRVRHTADRLLVTFGGADPGEYSEWVLPVLDELQRTRALEIRLVVGPANVRADPIRAAAPAGVQILTQIDDMAACLKWADVVLSSGGGTVWELAYLGIPAVVGAAVEMEEPLVMGDACAPHFVPVGRLRDLDADALLQTLQDTLDDPDLRRRLSRVGQATVDGLGPQRVIQEMRR